MKVEPNEYRSFKEQIEEASEIILANNIDGLKDVINDDDLFYFYKGVIQQYGIAMAEWQKSKMYSEEEVKRFTKHCLNNYELRNNRIDFTDWFNQFKKE